MELLNVEAFTTKQHHILDAQYNTVIIKQWSKIYVLPKSPKRSGRQAFESSCYVEWTAIYAAGLWACRHSVTLSWAPPPWKIPFKAGAVFDYFGRAFDEERMRTDPPAKRWMRVSRSPITIAQQPWIFRSLLLLLLALNLSSLQFCHSLSSSLHPIPALPRSVRWVSHLLRRRNFDEQQQLRLVAVCAAARRTLPHTRPPVTGPRNSPGPSTLDTSLHLLHFVSSFHLYATPVLSFTKMSLWLVLLFVSVWGPKQRDPVEPGAAFAPPTQCNAMQLNTEHRTLVLASLKCLGVNI